MAFPRHPGTAMSLVIALLVVAVAALLWMRSAAQRQGARRRHAALDERQAALTALVAELGHLLDDPHRPADEIEQGADAIIGRMRTHNVDGQLDEFIADNEGAIAEALAARRARG